MAMASVGHSSDEDFDQLPYEGYRKLNACRDSHSEIHISDDDVGGDAKPYEAKRRTRDIDAHLKAVPEQVRQELPKEKSMYRFPKCYNPYLIRTISENFQICEM